MNYAIDQPAIEFIINKSHYFVPSVLVKAFSKTILEQNQHDESFIYEFENLNDPHGLFNLVVNLFYGQSIDINANNAFFFGYIGDILGIAPLSEATDSYRQIQLTMDNIFDMLGYLDAYHITYPKIIHFAGENWPLLSKSKKSTQLSFFILDKIFSNNPQISVDFDFVVKVIEENSCVLSQNDDEFNKNEFVLLFKYCDFSKLTSFQLEEIFEYVSFDSIPCQILEKLIHRVSIEENAGIEKNDNSPKQDQMQESEKSNFQPKTSSQKSTKLNQTQSQNQPKEFKRIKTPPSSLNQQSNKSQNSSSTFSPNPTSSFSSNQQNSKSQNQPSSFSPNQQSNKSTNQPSSFSPNQQNNKSTNPTSSFSPKQQINKSTNQQISKCTFINKSTKQHIKESI